MIDVNEKKRRIVSYIRENGPSLPVRIAKAIEMSPVFASAILAEMLGEKTIKASFLKVGSSPLYFLPGQERMLESFSNYLNGVEKEAFLKLKEKGVLEDRAESPAIRVALRNLRDFAIPFKEEGRIFWKYAFLEEKAKPKKELKKEDSTAKAQEKGPALKKKSQDFFEEVLSFIKSRGLEFIEKIQVDKKEVVGKVRVKSNLGNIDFLLVAKNKKTITKDEVSSAKQRADYERMPCLIVVRKTPVRSVQNLIEENRNLIKLLVLE
ncbi:hypothetical protein D6829_00100 [Candidatus Pacearchaeota archaeon]|nr:MAG: hypothetical protein D6829_00100 [Candidatus Pacearchaeota archaeon]